MVELICLLSLTSIWSGSKEVSATALFNDPLTSILVNWLQFPCIALRHGLLYAATHIGRTVTQVDSPLRPDVTFRGISFSMWRWSRCFPIILVNNQLDAQFFMYVYFYSLHVSGSHVPIIRRIIVSMRHLVYVTLCRWPSGTQEHMLYMFLYMFRAAICPS